MDSLETNETTALGQSPEMAAEQTVEFAAEEPQVETTATSEEAAPEA